MTTPPIQTDKQTATPMEDLVERLNVLVRILAVNNKMDAELVARGANAIETLLTQQAESDNRIGELADCLKRIAGMSPIAFRNDRDCVDRMKEKARLALKDKPNG